MRPPSYAVGIAVVLVLITAFPNPSRALLTTTTTGSIRLSGSPEVVFDWSRDACERFNYPDLPVRVFRDYRGRTQLLLSHFDNFRMVGPSLDQLHVDCDAVMRSDRDRAPNRFDDREWLGSVYTQDGRRIWALVHDEYQGNRHPGRCPSGVYLSCWYNAITLARSDDGGRTFRQAQPPGQLVASPPFRYRPDSGPAGIFSPSNIVTTENGEHYALVRIRDPDGRRGVCLMRTRRIGNPSTWRSWTGNGFDGHFRDPYLTPNKPHVNCGRIGVGRIAEMAESLTYSTALGKFLLVGLAPPFGQASGSGEDGIYFSTSDDLIHWTPRKLILKVTTVHTYRCGGPSPIAYPSLVDPSSQSRTFATTGANPYLYFTQFNYVNCQKTADRDLVRVPLSVSN